MDYDNQKGMAQVNYPTPARDTDIAGELAELSRAADDLRSARTSLTEAEDYYGRALDRWRLARQDAERFASLADEAWGGGYTRPEQACKAAY